VALVVMSVLGAGAMVSFARLHPDAGARLAGREVRGGTA
jgi:hypothetical protein